MAGPALRACDIVDCTPAPFGTDFVVPLVVAQPAPGSASIYGAVTALLKLIPADIETNFDVDEQPSRNAA